MQFYTAELQELINQLSQGGGAGGYFYTLGLIFKLIGLTICPILCFVVVAVLFFKVPRFVVRKMLTKDRLKEIVGIFVYKNKIELYIGHLSQKYKFIEVVFLVISFAIMTFDFILLAPFFFVSGTSHNLAVVLTILGMFALVICFFISCYLFSDGDYVSYLPLYMELEKQVDEFAKTLEKKQDDQGKSKFVLSNEEIIKKLTETFGDRVTWIETV